MIRPIFTSLSPNLEEDDVKIACSLICKPTHWHQEEAVRTLEEEFMRRFPSQRAFAFATGRTCLFALLSQLNLQTDDEVLLQAYTCVAVPNPILWTKAHPIYVDCERETLNLSVEDLRRKITSKSRVLIIQHTFGQPARLKELLEIARAHHLFVIEDCAHALGARYDGNLVGSFGDVSFFSFGRDKVLSSVFGGMLLVKDPALASKIAAYQSSLPQPKKSWVFQQLLHPLLTSSAKKAYPLGIGKIILALGRKTRLLSQPVEPQEKQGEAPSFVYYRFSGALAELALHQLKKLERFQRHRTELATHYTHALKGSSFTLLSTGSNTSPAWLRFTIQTPRAKEILRDAKREQIHLGDWYRTPIAPQGVNYERICYYMCSNAEAIAKETVNLPTDIHITLADADQIIQFLKRYV